MRLVSLEWVTLVVLVLPLLWTMAFSVLRFCFTPGTDGPDDKVEKLNLLVMILPLLAGVLFVFFAPLSPKALPVSAMPMVGVEGDMGVVQGPIAAVSHPAINFLHVGTQALLGLYLMAACLFAARLAVAQLRLAFLVARAGREDICGEGVRVTSSSVPPLAWGRKVVLLPRSLVVAFSDLQIGLIIRHEREHLRRGDGPWFAVLAWVDAILWFNPVVRAQTQKCRLAAELACDAAVLQTAPEMRGEYAQTLVKTLKHTAGNALSISTQSGVPAVFSPEKSGDYRMRISEIMRPSDRQRKPRHRWLYIVALALAVPVGLTQFAWSQGAPVSAPVPAIGKAVGPVSLLPVAPIEMPVTSAFGDRVDPRTHKPAFHKGVDFMAPTGTPVMAAGEGTINAVTYNKWGMGHLIQIDHGGTLVTFYAHLDSVAVKVGDHVKAGQVIAASGSSGISTGPHLHFEVWRDGKPVDPVAALPQNR